MNRVRASGAAVLVALLALTGCAGQPSAEQAASFKEKWSALSSGERKDACWAATAQALPDQGAVAAARLEELFGSDWTGVTGLIEKRCT